MIRIYKNTTQQLKLKRIKQLDKAAWLNVVDPTEKEIKQLTKASKLSRETLQDALDQLNYPELNLKTIH